MEEKYTIKQILDALVQADDAVVTAIQYQDRDMLRASKLVPTERGQRELKFRRRE